MSLKKYTILNLTKSCWSVLLHIVTFVGKLRPTSKKTYNYVPKKRSRSYSHWRSLRFL